jgi:hypothetical protein
MGYRFIHSRTSNPKNKIKNKNKRKRGQKGKNNAPKPSEKSLLTMKILSKELFISGPSNLFINWLEKLIHGNSELTRELLNLSTYFQTVLNVKGPSIVVKLIKEIKIILDCYLNEDPSIKGRLSFNRLSYDNLPWALRTIFRFLREKQPTYIITVGSFLSYTRILIRENIGPNEGLGTIETEPTPLPVRHKNAFQLFTGHLHDLSEDKKAFLIKPSFSSYHLTSKGGPLNVHALMSCYWDLENLNDELYKAICVLGGPILESSMELNKSYITSLKTVVSKLLNKRERKKVRINSSVRSIVRFGDPEYKLRVVAIGDYWSQAALKPLHEKITQVLKSIPQDQSFDQAEGLPELSKLSVHQSIKFFCYDLTSFTDTFPLQLIVEWVSFMWGTEYSEALNFIMTGIEFEVQGTKLKVQYKTGNPMGFYGSFTLTSLLHHFLFFECCLELNIKWSDAKYKLLGDDVIIWDERLALNYSKRLQQYNIKKSDLKTIIGNYLFEFAKRKFYRGVEVSPISYKAFLKANNSINELVEFVKQCKLKGAFTKGTTDNIVDLTCQTYEVVTGRSRPKDKRYLTNLVKFEYLILHNKRDNRNVGRIISAALASHSHFLPTNILETKESKDILFRIYYICMKKRLEQAINQWIDKDGNVELYLHTYLSTLIPKTELAVFKQLPANLLNSTPITENFHDIVVSVFRTLLFVKSEFEDETDTEAFSAWYSSTLETESWLKRKSSKEKDDFHFSQSRVNFSSFSKLLRQDIRVHFKENKNLWNELINSCPLTVT